MRTSLRLLALFIGLGAIWPLAPAHAQTVSATVVTTCGTLGTPYVAGQSFPITMDVTGTLCTGGGGGGGGGAITAADGAIVTMGHIADAAWTGTGGTPTEISLLKGIFFGLGPANSTGAYSAVTVGVSSAQAVAASTAKVFLDLVNTSATATVACNVGGTAVINGAGSITLPPGWHRSWEGTYVPSDAVNCIASAASTPFTVGAK